jgi:hypothetical protein
MKLAATPAHKGKTVLPFARTAVLLGPAPLALCAIFQWIPLTFAIGYWQRLLGSPRGEYSLRAVRGMRQMKWLNWLLTFARSYKEKQRRNCCAFT